MKAQVAIDPQGLQEYLQHVAHPAHNTLPPKPNARPWVNLQLPDTHVGQLRVAEPPAGTARGEAYPP